MHEHHANEQSASMCGLGDRTHRARNSGTSRYPAPLLVWVPASTFAAYSLNKQQQLYRFLPRHTLFVLLRLLYAYRYLFCRAKPRVTSLKFVTSQGIFIEIGYGDMLRRCLFFIGGSGVMHIARKHAAYSRANTVRTYFYAYTSLYCREIAA